VNDYHIGKFCKIKIRKSLIATDEMKGMIEDKNIKSDSKTTLI
jgi:hypothetical protein